MEKSKACIHCGNYGCLELQGARICPRCYVRSVSQFLTSTNKQGGPQMDLFEGGKTISIDVQ